MKRKLVAILLVLAMTLSLSITSAYATDDTSAPVADGEDASLEIDADEDAPPEIDADLDVDVDVDGEDTLPEIDADTDADDEDALPEIDADLDADEEDAPPEVDADTDADEDVSALDSADNAALAFDAASYTTLTVDVDGTPMDVRKYNDIVYVANPVDVVVAAATTHQYQRMDIYVPESAFADTEAPIYFVVGNSGWMPSASSLDVASGWGGGSATFVDGSSFASATSNIGAALSAGYVIADVGTRSRGLVDTLALYVGKAPAVVVDAKAAVRYLRLNDGVMPGSAERVIITGTSGGGGLSVAVAASGNSPDYYPYLAEIGAAGINASGGSTIRDDVFATVAYCPITDLNNADMAYEWQYNAVRTDTNTTTNAEGLNYTTPSALSGAGGITQAAASTALAAAYTDYLAGLGLLDELGAPLTTDNLDDAIVRELTREVEESIADGLAVPDLGENFVIAAGGGGGGGGSTNILNDWLDINGGSVVSINYANYLTFVARTATLKAVPAFDNVGTSLAATQNETNLFGSDAVAYQNVSTWAWNNNITSGDGSGADDTGLDWAGYMATDDGAALALQAKMINPLPYLLSSSDGDSAPYWYLRHGARDRDTSFAVEMELRYAVMNDPAVVDLNFELAWLQPHSGNYDVPEAFAWIAEIVGGAGAPPADVEDAALAFDAADYTTLNNVTIDGIEATVQKYSGITYVANPVDVWLSGIAGWGGAAETRANAWQMLNAYVPANATQDSAIILVVNNAGWNNSPLGNALNDNAALSSASNTDKYGAALKAGYVVVEIGTRSRGIEGALSGNAQSGTYPGKAPAVVVDAKAAVRYLRLNDAVMPGSAERIVITGTSGGGGLSTAVAASGNAQEYYPYLKEIGAAGIAANGSSTLRDDVFGTIAYCPITDLNNADMAYEWTYNAVRTDANTTANVAGDTYNSANADSIDGDDASMKAASAWLKSAYVSYFNGLGLRDESGAALTTSNLAAAIEREVTAEIQETLLEGGDPVPNYGENFVFPGSSFGGGAAVDTVVENDWYKYDTVSKKVTEFYYDKFLTFVAGVTKLKAIPAFDNVGTTLQTTQNETNLGGPIDVVYRNFSEFAWNHNNTLGDGSGSDDTGGLAWEDYLLTTDGQALALQTQMINPIPYLTDSVITGTDAGDSAPYWYVRHGARDRDTSFAVELELKYALLNNSQVKDADFELAWLKPHSGDYDVQEAYTWLADVLAANVPASSTTPSPSYSPGDYPELSESASERREQPERKHTLDTLDTFGTFSGSGTLTARINAAFSTFAGLYYKAGNPSNMLQPGTLIPADKYDVTEGSTIITLKESYLRTFPAGTHTLTASFAGNAYAEISLEVSAAAAVTPIPVDTTTETAATGSLTTPPRFAGISTSIADGPSGTTTSSAARTGDDFMPLLWILLLILAAAGCVWTLRRYRKAAQQTK